MRAHILEHVPFEGPGSIAFWLKEAGYQITHTRFYDSADLPELKAIDLLIVMGGPMSVNDEDRLSWLALEKKYICEAIDSGKPVLGICLGAQLIACAAGARVYQNPEKEIGWFPIQGLLSNDRSVFNFPQSLDVFHWHGETFDLPAGAVRIAESRGCKNQAFQMGRSVIGLQFHLETTPETARELVFNCRDELIPSPYVQTEDKILSAKPDQYQSINGVMNKILDFLVKV